MLQTTSQPPPAYPFILRILNLILQSSWALKPRSIQQKTVLMSSFGGRFIRGELRSVKPFMESFLALQNTLISWTQYV